MCWPWWVSLVTLLVGYGINWIIHLLSTGETENIVADSTEKITKDTGELKEGQQEIKQDLKKFEGLLCRISQKELEENTDLSREQIAATSGGIASSFGQYVSPVFQGGAAKVPSSLMFWTKDGPKPLSPFDSMFYVNFEDFGKSLAQGNADVWGPKGEGQGT